MAVDVFEIKADEDRQAYIKARRDIVESQRRALRDRLDKNEGQSRKLYATLLVLGLLIAIASLLSLLRNPALSSQALSYLALPTYSIIGIWIVMFSRARVRSLKDDLQDNRFEEELLRSEATPQESRAEELLRMYQYQLKRYYDLNLSQNVWVFGIGIFCIVLGVIVIGITVYLITVSPREAWQEKVVLGLVGAIGSLMTNYIAAVYLKMHSATTGSLTTFYSSLVSTHQLFLANLLVSRIGNEDKRSVALANVSLAIARYEVSEKRLGQKQKPNENSEHRVQPRTRKKAKEVSADD